MKENIEEDLKVLEELAKNEYGELLNCWDFGERSIKAINNILSDYKRVLKENEDWQKAYQEEKDNQFELLRETQKLQDENKKRTKQSNTRQKPIIRICYCSTS